MTPGPTPPHTAPLGLLAAAAALAALVAAGCGGGGQGTRLAGETTGALAVAGDGTAWVGTTNRARNAHLERVLRDGDVGTSQRLAAPPREVVAAGDAIWVLDASGLGRVDAVSGAVVDRLPLPPPDTPQELAYGARSAWVVSVRYGGPTRATLLRVDPAAMRVTGRVALGGGREDVQVARGRVWVTDREGARVVALHPRTLRVTGTVPLDGSSADLELAPPVAGRLWAADAGRLHAVTGAADRGWLPLAAGDGRTEVIDLAAGDARLWVAHTDPAGGDPRLAEVDPATGRTVAARAIEAGTAVRGLAVGGGLAWVAVDDRLARITLGG